MSSLTPNSSIKAVGERLAIAITGVGLLGGLIAAGAGVVSCAGKMHTEAELRHKAQIVKNPLRVLRSSGEVDPRDLKLAWKSLDLALQSSLIREGFFTNIPANVQVAIWSDSNMLLNRGLVALPDILEAFNRVYGEKTVTTVAPMSYETSARLEMLGVKFGSLGIAQGTSKGAATPNSYVISYANAGSNGQAK